MLAAIAFSVAVGFGVVSPALPLYAQHFGVGPAAAAAVVSVFAFVRLVGGLPGGSLVDRFGERRVMVTGIVVVALSSALAGFAQTYLQLIVLRGVGGFGSAMFSVSSRTLLLRAVPASLRGRASGVYSGGFLLGGIAGPALGGFVTGVSIRAPFFLYAALLVIPSALGFRALRDPPAPAPGDRVEARSSLRTMLADPSYVAACVANLADGWAVVGVRSAMVPLFVANVLHRGTLWTGVGFVVVAGVNAAVLLPGGRVSDTYGRRPVIVAGCAVSAAALVLLALVPSLGGYLAAMVVLGAGSGLLDVGPAAMVGDLLTGRGGLAIAAFGMASDAGVIAGPVVAGHLAATVSYRWAFLTTAAVLGLGALAGLRAREPRRGVERTL